MLFYVFCLLTLLWKHYWDKKTHWNEQNCVCRRLENGDLKRKYVAVGWLFCWLIEWIPLYLGAQILRYFLKQQHWLLYVLTLSSSLQLVLCEGIARDRWCGDNNMISNHFSPGSCITQQSITSLEVQHNHNIDALLTQTSNSMFSTSSNKSSKTTFRSLIVL